MHPDQDIKPVVTWMAVHCELEGWKGVRHDVDEGRVEIGVDVCGDSIVRGEYVVYFGKKVFFKFGVYGNGWRGVVAFGVVPPQYGQGGCL